MCARYNHLIYIKKDRLLQYYRTFDQKISGFSYFIKHVETLEIIINTNDNEGGTGANFVFEWLSTKTISKPLFESVMISTREQQGIAFTCRELIKSKKIMTWNSP
ncbi:MAG: DUF3124 domain-containing protein [Bacteroidia bacterium]